MPTRKKFKILITIPICFISIRTKIKTFIVTHFLKNEYFYIILNILIQEELQPRMPGRVHPAKVVGRICRGHQGADLALRPVEGRKTRQPLSDCRNGLRDEVDDDLPIAIFGLLLRSV